MFVDMIVTIILLGFDEAEYHSGAFLSFFNLCSVRWKIISFIL